jgi:7,8-dihydroneopterin aldolase/epimerase/oxygenase
VTDDRVLLEGMVFIGHHGAIAAERELGQRFVVDVEMAIDLRRAGRSDDLAETVDYGQVHEQVRAIVEGPSCNLIEAVADRIAAAILDRHAAVEAVRVKVAKPEVRLGTVLAGAAVEIARRRNQAASAGR